MKHALLTLAMGLAVFGLTGCVDLDPAALGGYGGGYDSGYRPGYRPPPSSYNGGYYNRPYYDGHSHYDDHSHSSHNDNSYYGGPHAWYEAGKGLGKRDRKEHVSPNYRRHKTQYDGKTEREFARGYTDGYNGR
jgi:hypothetical protein